METALKKYQVAKFTKTKTTPIQAKLQDFPTLENLQVNIFDIDLEYPTTSAVLTNYMIEQTGITADRIRVRSPLEDAESELNAEHLEVDKKALLTQDYQKENNQNSVGDKGISNFLKDIAKVRKEHVQYKGVNDAILAKKTPKEKAQDQAKPSAGTSPIGSAKGKTK